MDLQLSFKLAVDVRHVGELALVGTAIKYSCDREGEKMFNTVASFLLAFEADSPLATYFNPRIGFRPQTLLYEIFVGEGFKVVRPVHWFNATQRLLFFTREVEGELCNPRDFLHSTAKKLLRELQEIENDMLLIIEMDDQVEWAEEDILHPGLRGPMPDFTRPRHT